MKKIIGILAVVMVMLLTSCTGVVNKNELEDGLKDEYKLVIPFVTSENTQWMGDVLYFHELNLTESSLMEKFEEYGYSISKTKDYANEDCMIISLYVNSKLTPLFVVNSFKPKDSKNESEVHFRARALTDYVGHASTSFPKQLVSSDAILDDNKFTYDTNATFEDLKRFYESSLSGYHSIDEENKIIIANAIDDRTGSGYNALIQIKYVESAEGNKLEGSRVYDLD